jgi:hypothetical protein
MPSDIAYDANARAQTAEWLRLWARNGPELEALRVSELRQLSEADSARIAVEVVWPMAPVGSGDDGEGLRRMRTALDRMSRWR